MYRLYREEHMEFGEIADYYDCPYEYVKKVYEEDGWDDYLEDGLVAEYTEISMSLPYPRKVADLIAHLYFIRNTEETICDILPTPDRLTLLHKVETHILKYTKQHISTVGLTSMTLPEARRLNVPWLSEFETYLDNIIEAEVVDD